MDKERRLQLMVDMRRKGEKEEKGKNRGKKFNAISSLPSYSPPLSSSSLPFSPSFFHSHPSSLPSFLHILIIISLYGKMEVEIELKEEGDGERDGKRKGRGMGLKGKGVGLLKKTC